MATAPASARFLATAAYVSIAWKAAAWAAFAYCEGFGQLRPIRAIVALLLGVLRGLFRRGALLDGVDRIEILHGELQSGRPVLHVGLPFRPRWSRHPADRVERALVDRLVFGQRLRHRFGSPLPRHHAGMRERQPHAMVFQAGRDGLDFAKHLEHRFHGRLAAHGADLVGIDRLRRRVGIPGGLAEIRGARVVIADQPLPRAESADAGTCA